MTQLPSSQQPTVGGTRLVIAALVLATLAVVLNSFYIRRVKQDVEQDIFTVYTLTRSVKPGDTLREQDVKKIPLPKRFEEAFKNLGALDEAELDVKLNTPLQRFAAAGEILRNMHFYSVEGKNFDAKIPTGRRLVSLPVNSRTVPGFLREGMYIDIEAPFQTGGALPIIMPVMENVQVIAMGTRTVYDETDPARYRPLSSYNSITIVVLPGDATNLAEIERAIAGDFEIALRNPGDQKPVKIQPDPLRPNSEINPKVLDLIDKKTAEPAVPKR